MEVAITNNIKIFNFNLKKSQLANCYLKNIILKFEIEKAIKWSNKIKISFFIAFRMLEFY